MDRRAWLSKALAVFGAGFISFLGQGAVFRDFLGVFEGGELSAGLFLAFWLLWLSFGAMLAGLLPKLAGFGAKHFRLLILLYVPALAAQMLMTSFARELAGFGHFEVFPVIPLLLACLAASAPLSLLTGALFVSAGLMLKGNGVPAARVYAIEALGSCAGALVSTALLWLGLGDAQLILAGAVCIGAFSLLSCLMAEMRYIWLAPACITLFCAGVLGSGQGAQLDQHLDELAFKRLVPDGAFKGSFTTRQARYLTGERNGQLLVLAWGSVIENIPGRESSILQAAYIMAQAPEAKRILVSGSNSLSLAMTFAKLGKVNEVQLSSTDPDFPAELLKRLPSALIGKELSAIKASGLDPKAFLEKERGFDLAVINSVNLASLSSIRFMSKDFMQSVKSSLSPGGVMAYSFPGSENFLSPELAKLGSSIYRAINASFKETVLKPGSQTCIFAAKENGIICSVPEELIARASRIRGLPELLSPETLRYEFDSSLSDSQRKQYIAAEGQAKSAFGAALAYSAKLLGLGGGSRLLREGAMLFLGLLFLPVAFRAALIINLRRRKEKQPFQDAAAPYDSLALIAGAAAASSGIFIILLAKRQCAFGTLMLDYGLMNACFMAGLLAGSLSLDFLQRQRRFLLGTPLLPFGLLLLGWTAIGEGFPPQALIAQALFAGLLCGVSVAAATGELKLAGLSDAKLAFSLEAVDCLGGCLGCLFTALALIPLLGLNCGEPLAGGLLLLALMFMFSLRRRSGATPRNHPALNVAALALCALACLLLALHERLDLHGLRLTLSLASLLGALVFLRFSCSSLRKEEEHSMPCAAKAGKFNRASLFWLFAALAAFVFAASLAFGGSPEDKSPASKLPLPEAAAFAPQLEGSQEAAKVESENPKGKTRKIDVAKLQGLIDSGRLSDKEASFWIPAEAK